MAEVLCLRPLADFTEVGVDLPEGLAITAMAPDDPALAAAMKTARALVIPAVGPALSTELFAVSTVELVQVTGAGVDRVQTDALSDLGIAVANVPGGSAAAVAEYVITAASALLRFLPESTPAILSGRYAETRKAMIGRGLNQLAGLTLGLVGHGVIGRATAARAEALGARVIFHDPAAEGGVALAELLATADIVSLHLPLLETTRGLIGADELAAMKPGAILINAARGGIVDEAALAEALETGRLNGAAVDVYATEPPMPDNPLLNVSDQAAQRLILTPHIAGVTRQAWASLFAQAWDNVARALLSGEPPQHVVNGVQATRAS